MIVADGVTHARVGRGERASEIACDVLVESIRKQFPQAGDNVAIDWPRIFDRSCLPASEAIVADTLGISDRPSRINDNDLMSTTALIGVLDGNELILANVGDSRAYLVSDGIAEQLTVDGDVAMSQLTREFHQNGSTNLVSLEKRYDSVWGPHVRMTTVSWCRIGSVRIRWSAAAATASWRYDCFVF